MEKREFDIQISDKLLMRFYHGDVVPSQDVAMSRLSGEGGKKMWRKEKS